MPKIGSAAIWSSQSAYLLAAVLLLGCDGAPSQPPEDDDLFVLPEFILTERDGTSFGSQDLKEKVWVASFVFTRCAGPCTRVSGTMAHLQHELESDTDARLVSFTVDPEYDQPKVLSAYAQKFGARPGRWYFLTGKPEQIYGLMRNGFHLTAQPNGGADRTPGNEVLHDTRLAVVDRRGHIRAYFDSSDADVAAAVCQKFQRLLAENR